ncbi:MAG: GDP-mannose 4,6-dehydratase [Fimbriimonadaceae bacterium]
MRVLITGGAGFIGSHVVDLLVDHGHTVAVLDNVSTGTLDNLNDRAAFHRLDITNFEETSVAVIGFQPEALIHLAAQVSVPRSFIDPKFDADVNVLGTLNLLGAARALALPPRFIFISSGGAVYGDAGEYPSTEATPPTPATPYGVAKLAGEHYVRVLSCGPFSILRFSNVYGPRQGTSTETGVCAVFARQVAAHEPLTVLGDGKQTRDYVYVADVARAVESALTLGDGEVLNVSSGVETSSGDLAQRVVTIAGGGAIQHLPARPGDVARSWLSCEKAGRILKWKPIVQLDEGLAATLSVTQAQVKVGG